MSDLEFRVSELYAECAGQYAENRQFWSGLSRAEVGYGETVIKMRPSMLKSLRNTELSSRK